MPIGTIDQPTIIRKLQANLAKRRIAFWLVFAALLLVQSLPFLLTQTPNLLDYPNHLARIFILNSWGVDSFLQQYYQPNWNVLPNLAFDGLGLLLNKVLPIQLTGQVILLVSVMLLATGLVALSAALHGTARPFSLVGFLFIFSQPFTYGFLSLMLGFGLLLWGVAVWIRLRDQPWQVVLAWSVPFALVLFFAHLFAFAAFGVTLASIEFALLLGTARPFVQFRRLVALGAAQVIVPASLFLFASPTPLSSSTTHYGSLLRRLHSMALSPVRNYDDALDILTFAAVVALFAFGFWTRRLQIAREMRLALIVLGLICLAMPDTLATSASAENRLPVALSLLLAASGSWTACSRREMAVGAMLLILLMVGRTWVTLGVFAQGDRFVHDLRSALTIAPRGARIASITLTTPSDYRMKPEWQHSICYEIIEKSALVPTVFAFSTQQPLLLGPGIRNQQFPGGHIVSLPGQSMSAALFDHLDYVVLVNYAALQAPLPENLQLVSTFNDFQIYRVR